MSKIEDFKIIDGVLEKYIGKDEIIVIPNNVTKIKPGAFSNCPFLESICVEKGNKHYKSIDGNVYSKNGKRFVIYAPGKKNLEFKIPSNVAQIERCAFFECKFLKTITIPASVTKVEIFDGCSSLENINVESDNQIYTSVDGNLYSKDNTQLIKYAPGKKEKTFKIPDNVTRIEFRAFFESSSLSNVEITNNVTDIGTCAFSNCSALKNIKFSNSVVTICYAAFSDCTSLESIEIPASVTTIKGSAFSGCSLLKTINVDYNNKYYTSFHGNLYSADCNYLIKYAPGKNETSFEIPNLTTKIEGDAFEDATFLESINVKNNHLTYVSIEGNLYSKDKTCLIRYAPGKKETSFKIPNYVTKIESYAFSKCSSLKSIEIPNSVTGIGMSAFSNCSSLKSIEIPNSVTGIESFAFSNCSSLKSIEIPNSVTYIGLWAFAGCNENFVIYTQSNSYAEKYAIENNIKVELI